MINIIQTTLLKYLKLILIKLQPIIDFFGTFSGVTLIINFVLLMMILIWICSKFNVLGMLETAKLKVKETIDLSTKTKEDSIKDLQEANSKIKNVEKEINEINSAGEENIRLLKDKIEKETQKEINSIKENTTKIIQTNSKEAISKISKSVANASIELAKKHIINVLNKKPEYHQHFIDESIKEIETGLK